MFNKPLSLIILESVKAWKTNGHVLPNGQVWIPSENELRDVIPKEVDPHG